MKGLILAGGSGTRLRPLTHTGAKQLIPIANKPCIFYAIEDMKAAGIEEIGIIVGYTKERIESITSVVGDGSRWGIKITYIEQDAPRGIAHAVYCAKDFMSGEDFVVFLGDNILKGGIKKYVDSFVASDADAGILVSKVSEPKKYGIAEIDSNGRIIGVEEKPEQPKSDLAITGVYLFKKSIFDEIEKIKPSKRGELDITSAIQALISNNKKVLCHIVNDWWDDTGTAESVLNANQVILSELKHEIHPTVNIENGAELIGRISIGKNSMIKNGSCIRGPAIIGENCTIGPNTYIGPYTSIGDNSKITGGEIESTIIVGNADIITDKKIVNSLIGRHVFIRPASNSLPAGNKFVIGENSRIQI